MLGGALALALTLPTLGCDASVSVAASDASPMDGAPSRDVTGDIPGGTPAQPPGPPPTFCVGPGEIPWNPTGDAPPAVWPDGIYTRVAGDSATGQRLIVDAQAMPWLADQDVSVQAAWSKLHGLDGFGVIAPMVVELEPAPEDVPTGELDSVSSAGLQLWDLGVDAHGEVVAAPSRVPYLAETVGDGGTLLVWPMRPLAPARRHGLIVGRGFAPGGADASGCYAPSAAHAERLTQAWTLSWGGALDGTPAPERRHAAAVSQLITRAAFPFEDVAVAAPFTTQETLREAVAVAKAIRDDTDHGWVGEATCTESGGGRTRCDRVFRSRDHRPGPGRDGEPADAKLGDAPTWELVMSAYLPGPDAPPGPWPTIFAGHGMSSNRGNIGGSVSKRLADLGVLVVTLDAIGHGDHPTAEGVTDLVGVTQLLGIDTDAVTVDGRKLRDNFRQSVFDRLHLLETLAASPDVDGDGTPDVDPDRMAYLGVSLGGIMGVQLLALSDRLQAAVLLVPGARLTSMVTHAPGLEAIIGLLAGLAGGVDNAWRLFAAVQAAVEPGDPASFAPHVLRDRLPGAGDRAPHVLVGMAMGDAVVPNVTTGVLARALGLPHLEPVVEPVGLVPVLAEAPVAGNVNGGATTAALFQFDRVGGPGSANPTDHDNMPFSNESVSQWRRFMARWVAGELPEIIDPYEVVGTPPLTAP